MHLRLRSRLSTLTTPTFSPLPLPHPSPSPPNKWSGTIDILHKLANILIIPIFRAVARTARQECRRRGCRSPPGRILVLVLILLRFCLCGAVLFLFLAFVLRPHNSITTPNIHPTPCTPCTPRQPLSLPCPCPCPNIPMPKTARISLPLRHRTRRYMSLSLISSMFSGRNLQWYSCPRREIKTPPPFSPLFLLAEGYPIVQ